MLPSKKKSCVRAGRAVKCNACGQKKKCLYLTGELSEDIPAACLTPIEANKENFPPTVAPPRKKKRKTDAHDHDADKLIELLQKKNDLLLQAIQTKQEDFALLEFDLYIKAYYQYVRSLRVIGCECEIIVPKNAHDFRAAFICPKPEGSNFYSKACINNTCDTCKDWNKVPQCTCRQHFPTIKYEKRTNIVVKNKFGQDVTKKDFVRTVSTFEEFWQDFVGYRSKYLLHHTKHIHQTAEFRYKISNLQRGEVLVVEDFSENGKLVRKFAQQDTHWAEHGYTLYPIVMLIRVEDLKDSFFTGGAAEKATLLEHFHQENKLPAILVNLTYLSDDVIHDNAMVQHAHGLAVEKLKEITLATPTGQSVIKTAHIFSDGGPSHYKLKDHVFFISKHYELFGMVCNWNYMCSGHGKNWSDPFGGWAKAVLNRVQLEAEDGQTASITTVAEAVEYLRDNYSRPTKRTQQKKGLSVYCNIYEYIPASGPGSVSRRHPKVADFPGVRKLHQILGARLPGRVHVREATCISWWGCDCSIPLVPCNRRWPAARAETQQTRCPFELA